MSRNIGIHFAPLSGFHGAKAAAGDHRQPRLSPAPVAASIQTMPASPGGNRRSPACHGVKQYINAEPISLAASKSSGSPASMRGNRSGHPGARNDDPLFPPLPAESILKPLNTIDALADVSPTVAVAQATIDFLKVLSAILLVAVTGAGIGASVLYFLFL